MIGKGSLDEDRLRGADADDFGADLYLSIHCNGGGGDGTETFWCDLEPFDKEIGKEVKAVILEDLFQESDRKDESKRFAKLVQKHIVAVHDRWSDPELDVNYDRRVVEDHTYLGYHLAILRHTKSPGCLNELAFVDTDTDRKKLLNEYWRGRFAEAYRDAIYEYFKLPVPSYLEIELADGWNMFSIPGIPYSSKPESIISAGLKDIFQSASGELFPQIAFQILQRDLVSRKSRYVKRVRFGQGYWIRASRRGGETIRLSYFEEEEYIIRLEEGYNMIGSVSRPVSFKDSVTELVSPTLWTWSPREGLVEVPSGRIEPGTGYVVKAHQQTWLFIGPKRQGAPQQLVATFPKETQVFTNFPNPFNPETWIPFHLREAGNVTVSIYTVSGHLIRTLHLGHLRSGIYTTKDRAAHWDGRNEHGDKAASGVYFYTLQTGDLRQTKKMLLLK